MSAGMAEAAPIRSIAVIGLLLIALICEGYDLQAANFAAPAIVAAFGISRAAIGPVLSASLLGVLIGAARLGPSGDRWGRKRVIVLGCVFYSATSLLAATATALWHCLWRELSQRRPAWAGHLAWAAWDPSPDRSSARSRLPSA